MSYAMCATSCDSVDLRNRTASQTADRTELPFS